MIRSITFIPSTGGIDDLTYVERASRNRSVHVLVQDTSGDKSPTRRRFLLRVYREVVSRYLASGRMELPLPLIHSTIAVFDEFSRRGDCLVDDFNGIGIYLLLQDGGTFYLLASREGKTYARSGGEFEPLWGGRLAGVTALPLDPTRTQTELFSQELTDLLVLHRIDAGAGGGSLDLAMGGVGGEMDGLAAALREPGALLDGAGDETVPVNLISHKMLYVHFEGSDRAISPVRSVLGMRPGWRWRRAGAALVSVVLGVAVVGLGAVWVGGRFGAGRDRGEESAEVAKVERGAAKSEEKAVKDGGGEVEGEVEGKGAHFAMVWKKTYRQAVTSTPVVVGELVVFGGRDGLLRALECETGREVWNHRAGDGIGSSPVVSGGRVMVGDYRGGVFAVGMEEGKRLWNRRLPQRVVSSPCVSGGEVVVGCYDGAVYAISAETGRVLWNLKSGARIRGSIACDGDQYYVPSHDGYVYAVGAGTGTVRWKYQMSGAVSSSPAADGEIVVVGGSKGGVVALERRNGAVRWRFETDDPVNSFLRLESGRLYAGSDGGVLYCLEAETGRPQWVFRTKGPVLGRPEVVDGWVVFGSYDRYVYCLDAKTGEEVDRFETSGPIFSSPAARGRRVYFGNNKGEFYCLELQRRGTS